MITAIILAAGKSKRMGQPKMLLPWGKGTLISNVISIFQKAGLDNILVVTGAAKEQVEGAISHLDVKTVFNRNFEDGEMLSSIQCGIRAVSNQTEAILIGLGDQPQVRAGSVRMVCDTFRMTESNLVVPSHQLKRGHPWLVARPLWKELLLLDPTKTTRSFLNSHKNDIHYVIVDDEGILADLDTPEDYQRWQSGYRDKPETL